MHYSFEPWDRLYVKDSWLLSFAKTIIKTLSSNYNQKRFDSDKKSTIDAIKTASKRAIQKTAESNWWLNW